MIVQMFHVKLKIMNNYIDFQYECNKLASEITDANHTLVYHLILAAASSDFDDVVNSCCKNLDLVTGCGFDFIHGKVVLLYHKFE